MFKALLSALFLLLSSVGVEAAGVPALKGRVNDYASILDAKERTNLRTLLAAYEKETTHQIAVLTVASLNGESIESFSLRVANAWALGRKGRGNGVLLAVAPSERKVRIELGAGMSRYVSDAQAQGIIADMLVSFRAGDLGGGVLVGVTQLMKACRAYEIQKRQIVASNNRMLLAQRPVADAGR